MDDLQSSAGSTANLNNLTRRYPMVNLGQVLNVLPEKRVLFVSNPKAGCSTVKLMLFKAYTGDYSLDPKNVHQVRALPSVKDIGWPNVAEMLSGRAYIFTFVRDPLARAVSAYSDKVVRQKRRYSGIFQRALGRPEDPQDPVTFEDFVAVLEKQSIDEMDPHWRPQHVNILHEAISYDRIGRLENFDADWSTIRAESGLPEVPIVHRNKRPSKFDITSNPGLVRRLQDLYARDFELFGY